LTFSSKLSFFFHCRHFISIESGDTLSTSGSGTRWPTADVIDAHVHGETTCKTRVDHEPNVALDIDEGTSVTGWIPA
jgi:hypothetical protein